MLSASLFLSLPVGDAPDDGFIGQLFLLCVYGFILFSAAEVLSNGSEMLLAIYGPGIIGGLIIPILGAVPDAAIILVSGLGPKESVQEQLSIGVGTLAGSTIMLLTVPFAASIYLGRRDRDPETGEAATYTDKNGAVRPKLTKFSWADNVVTTSDNVPSFARVMVLTTVSYFVIQVPAFFFDHDKNSADEENNYALAGLVCTVLMLGYYSWYQLVDAKHESMLTQMQREADRKRWKQSLAEKFSHVSAFSKIFHAHDKDRNGTLDRLELTEALRSLGLDVDREHISHIIESMDKDGDGLIDEGEFTSVIAVWMQENAAAERARIRSRRSSRRSSVHSGQSADDAATAAALASVAGEPGGKLVHRRSGVSDARSDGGGGGGGKTPSPRMSPSAGGSLQEPLLARVAASGSAAGQVGVNVAAEGGGGGGGDDESDAYPSDDDEEEEEEDEEYLELTDRQLIVKACVLLLCGTMLVTVFSDPMVDVISNFGKSIHVSPFYVSFVVTPLASNASEVLSALIFARKRTNRAISLTVSSLYGAASMNNTLGLAVFMALLYVRRLSWSYSAEVISILFVTYSVAAVGMRKTFNLYHAAFLAALYPFSIVVVVVLEQLGLQ